MTMPIASINKRPSIGDRVYKHRRRGGGDLLEPGDTISETESPVDIGELIGKYAFGDVKK